MDAKVHRKRRRSVRTGQIAGAVGALAGFDLTAYDQLNLPTSLCEMTVGAIAPMPWDGAWTVIAASLATIGAGVVNRRRWQSDEWAFRQNLHSPAWAGRRQRHRTMGYWAAVRESAGPRGDLSKARRVNASARDLGIYVGRTLSGPQKDRKRRVVIPWEHAGLLILGGQGSRKSTIAKGIIAGLPGSAFVASTKDEFIRDCAPVTARRGPNVAFDPTPNSTRAQWPQGVQQLRHNIISGSEDSSVAQRRARAMVDAAPIGKGGGNSEFFQSLARGLLAGLLQAAAITGASLVQVIRWVSSEEIDKPRRILEANPGAVAEATEVAIAKVGQDGATAQSTFHTLSSVFEWAQNSAAVEALDAPPAECTDLVQLIRDKGTLYVVSTENIPMSPALNLLWDEMVAAGRTVAQELPARRLTPPMTAVIDECDVSMRGVDLSTAPTKMRSDPGVFTVAITQNRARLRESLGEDRAEAFGEGFLHHLVTSPTAADASHYEEKVSCTRAHEVVKESESKAADTRRRMWNPGRSGHTASVSTETERPKLWQAEHWQYLRPFQGVLFSPGRVQAVVQIPDGNKVVADLAKGADETESEREMTAAAAAFDTERAEVADELAQRRAAQHGQLPEHVEDAR